MKSKYEEEIEIRATIAGAVVGMTALVFIVLPLILFLKPAPEPDPTLNIEMARKFEAGCLYRVKLDTTAFGNKNNGSIFDPKCRFEDQIYIVKPDL